MTEKLSLGERCSLFECWFDTAGLKVRLGLFSTKRDLSECFEEGQVMGPNALIGRKKWPKFSFQDSLSLFRWVRCIWRWQQEVLIPTQVLRPIQISKSSQSRATLFVYLLVRHVPFIAKGAVRILHWAICDTPPHDEPTDLFFRLNTLCTHLSESNLWYLNELPLSWVIMQNLSFCTLH